MPSFKKKFEYRSGPTNFQLRSGSKLFDHLMVYLRIGIEKSIIKIADNTHARKTDKLFQCHTFGL